MARPKKLIKPLPSKKGLIARTIAMGAIGVTVLTGSINHYRSEMNKIRIEQNAFDQRRTNEKQEHQRRIDEINKRRNQEYELARQESLKLNRGVDVRNLKTQFPELLSKSYMSHSEVRKYLIDNATRLAKNNKPISQKAMLENKKVLEPIVRKMAKKYGVNEEIMVKLIQNESRWDPFVMGASKDIGLGQLTPILWDSKTHKEFVCNPLNPVENIEVSVRYFSYLKKKFGNDKLALTAYNDGENVVRNKLKQGMSIEKIVTTNKWQYANRVLSQKS